MKLQKKIKSIVVRLNVFLFLSLIFIIAGNKKDLHDVADN